MTGNDVTEGKPKPDPYIIGAVTLGISPEKCGLSTVSDSPTNQPDFVVHQVW